MRSVYSNRDEAIEHRRALKQQELDQIEAEKARLTSEIAKELDKEAKATLQK